MNWTAATSLMASLMFMSNFPNSAVIHTTVSDILALLGVEVPTETVVSILNSLNLTCTLGEDGNSLSVTVPSYRDDVESPRRPGRRGHADLRVRSHCIHPD